MTEAQNQAYFNRLAAIAKAIREAGLQFPNIGDLHAMTRRTVSVEVVIADWKHRR
jgi:hypothetical protein